jgi:hypothetical protein
LGLCGFIIATVTALAIRFYVAQKYLHLTRFSGAAYTVLMSSNVQFLVPPDPKVLGEKEARLRELLRGLGRVIIALSG